MFICVTESWLDNDVPDNCLTLRNYALFRADRETGVKGGGICVWIRCDFQVSILFSKSDNHDFEVLILLISHPSFRCILVTLYFPHGLRLNSVKIGSICDYISKVIDCQLITYPDCPFMLTVILIMFPQLSSNEIFPCRTSLLILQGMVLCWTSFWFRINFSITIASCLIFRL